MAENYIGNAPGVVAAGPASQAEQEAATATDRFVTPAVQKCHPSAAKAWAKINQSTNTLLAGYNIASITAGSAGRTTVTLAVPFSSADYCIQVTVYAPGGGGTPIISAASTPAPTASAFGILSTDVAGTAVNAAAIFIACFGDQ